MQIDKHNPPSSVIYNNIKYSLMGGRRYYLSYATSNEGRKKPKGLHVAIWEDANNRSVKPGEHIHHKDSDTFNNDPSNLECVAKEIHYRMPKKLDMDKIKANLDKQRHLATAWHKSEAGMEWHRQHARNCMAKRKKHDKTCEYCGNLFTTIMSSARFCHRRCRENWNYHKK